MNGLFLLLILMKGLIIYSPSLDLRGISIFLFFLISRKFLTCLLQVQQLRFWLLSFWQLFSLLLSFSWLLL